MTGDAKEFHENQETAIKGGNYAENARRNLEKQKIIQKKYTFFEFK